MPGKDQAFLSGKQIAEKIDLPPSGYIPASLDPAQIRCLFGCLAMTNDLKRYGFGVGAMQEESAYSSRMKTHLKGELQL
ncbi:MAG: hypothetical protein A2Z51_08985 [Deltaproteobacteria bacterium RBG_19FT_COMBO_52_11]|jgi:hypothetical protein|nr:MAG: hypothetical protein A2Z51_08985 [Deltaproteobacteria bacterium RBG_19FT_COMBO_52_11]